jgi:hypothetical protein
MCARDRATLANAATTPLRATCCCWLQDRVHELPCASTATWLQQLMHLGAGLTRIQALMAALPGPQGPDQDMVRSRVVAHAHCAELRAACAPVSQLASRRSGTLGIVCGHTPMRAEAHCGAAAAHLHGLQAKYEMIAAAAMMAEVEKALERAHREAAAAVAAPPPEVRAVGCLSRMPAPAAAACASLARVCDPLHCCFTAVRHMPAHTQT